MKLIDFMQYMEDELKDVHDELERVYEENDKLWVCKTSKEPFPLSVLCVSIAYIYISIFLKERLDPDNIIM